MAFLLTVMVLNLVKTIASLPPPRTLLPLKHDDVAKPVVRWFVTSDVVHQPDQLAFAMSKQTDGVLPCCHLLAVDAEGHLNSSSAAKFWASSNFSALRAVGKQVVVDIGGDQTACSGMKNKSSCAMWDNRVKLAADIAAFAQRYSIDGFTLDWEFGNSFDYLSWNRTWTYIAAELAPLTFEVCINSVVEHREWVSGGDPSGNPFFRPVPWASTLTDMGSYSLCGDNNCTDAERQYNLTTNLERYTNTNTSGWAGGLEGVSTNLLKLANARADQLSPGLWFDDKCTPTGEHASDGITETSTHGWTASTLRAFLANQYQQGVRSVDVWCGVGTGLPMPCPTCPWVFAELERFQSIGDDDIVV